jgi:signal transduction histidine kinase
MGFSQAMVDGLGGEMSEKQEKYIKIINKNSNEILYFMDKILELSKTESNLFEYDYQTFDIVNAMQNIIKIFEQPIKDKNLILTFDTEELSKRTVYTVENAFKVIFQNILETSVSSTDIGSINIKIGHPDLQLVSQAGFAVSETSSEKSFIALTVTDTGAGLSESDLQYAFEPYAQLDRANKKNIVKTIALASARNITKYLKGEIWLESEPMQGSRYTVILPIEKV